jgi:hypothetical protein
LKQNIDMSEAGTLLSNLDGMARPSDGDLVDSILADMNQSSGSNPVMSNSPPPVGARIPMQPVAPMSGNFPTATDPAVPTAHMIGRDHPTEADFQRMMMAAQGQLPFQTPPQQMQQQQPLISTETYVEPKKNAQGQWIDELKQPIIVAMIVFLMTLPAVNLLVSHYAPQLLRPGGDFTTMGSVARALVGGGLFWVLQRVIAPLLSL